MENSKMLTILILALALIFCSTGITTAAPVGTAFTYQGRLMEDDIPADGLHDFQFSLYDDPNTAIANQIGTAIDRDDLDVIDGYFTVELDFGSDIFTGDARWLEITVAQSNGSEPNDFVTLTPRLELTPTPYAMYAETARAARSLDAADGSPTDALYVDDTGKVGIGTISPSENLEVNGTVKATAFVGDGSGLTNLPIGYDSDWTISGSNMYSAVSGNVGIGTSAPSAKLDVEVISGGAATIGSGTNSATGDYAIAMGHDTTAGGYTSTAMGNYTTASGSYSTAMGSSTIASGFASTAMGNYTTASGNYSTAMGYSTDAIGGYSTAMGEATTASGYNSTAIGRKIEAAGDYSVAIALADMDGAQVTQDNTMAILGGNVGIGTTTPSYTLHVVGNIAYTGSISDISDLRLKENITPLENGVEKVSCLKGIYFNNKGDSPDKREVGVIAQDVEKVLPELVSTDKLGYKSVDYTKLTPVLIEAVKELKAENDELQEQNNRLESRLSALENAMRSGSLIGKEL